VAGEGGHRQRLQNKKLPPARRDRPLFRTTVRHSDFSARRRAADRGGSAAVSSYSEKFPDDERGAVGRARPRRNVYQRIQRLSLAEHGESRPAICSRA